MINIIYANVTSKDIDDVQKKYRMEVPGTSKENTKFAIRALPEIAIMVHWIFPTWIQNGWLPFKKIIYTYNDRR